MPLQLLVLLLLAKGVQAGKAVRPELAALLSKQRILSVRRFNSLRLTLRAEGILLAPRGLGKPLHKSEGVKLLISMFYGDEKT